MDLLDWARRFLLARSLPTTGLNRYWGAVAGTFLFNRTGTNRPVSEASSNPDV